jgi:hypothetical protein
MRILEFRIRDVLDLDHTRLEIYDAAVLAHDFNSWDGSCRIDCDRNGFGAKQ